MFGVLGNRFSRKREIAHSIGFHQAKINYHDVYIHILTCEDVDDNICFFMVVCANCQFVYIIKRKLHSGLNIYYFIPYQIQPFRNKNQVYLLLHAIRQVLPDDVRILADPELELAGVKTSLCALNQEITNLHQNLQSLSQNSDKSHARFYTSYGHGPECRVKDGDDVRALRKYW